MIYKSQNEPISDKYPYVLWRLGSRLAYRLEPLPALADRPAAISRVSRMTAALRRRCALVFGPHDCVYFEPDGSWRSAEPPRGGMAFVAPEVAWF